MQLQGRILSIRMRGDDVVLLQQELRQLGLTIEDREGYFGKSTHLAVLKVQRAHDLEPIGDVDECTAALISLRVDARGKPKPAGKPKKKKKRGNGAG